MLHVQADTTGLAAALQKILPAVREQENGLNAITLTAENDRLTLDGGYEKWATIHVPAQVIDTGTVNVNAKYLDAIIRLMESGVDADIRETPTGANNDSTMLVVRDTRSRDRIPTLLQESMPQKPGSIPDATHDAPGFGHLLQLVAKQAAGDSDNGSAIVLKSIRLTNQNGTLGAETTNRYTAARARMTSPDGLDEGQWLIPASWAPQIKDATKVGVNDHMLSAYGETPDVMDWTLSTPLSSGQYPSIDRFFTPGDTGTVEVPADSLHQTVSRLSRLASAIWAGLPKHMRLEAQQGGVLTARLDDSTEGSSGLERIPDAKCHAPVGFGVDAEYLLSALDTLQGTVTIHLPSGHGPVVMVDDSDTDVTQVIVPLRDTIA